MKNTKKFAAMIAALTLSACSIAPMAMTSYAASVTSFNMTKPSNLPDGTAVVDSAVTAYKVFDLTKVGSGYEANGWGTDINASALIDALTGASADAAFIVDDANVFAGITYNTDNPADSAAKVAAVISKFSDGSKQAEAFAKAVMKNLATEAQGTVGKYTMLDATNGTVSFAPDGLNDGYYVMSCAVYNTDDDIEIPGNNNSSVSLGMLTVVDGTVTGTSVGTGTAKVGLPSVMKKVLEDDGKATDAASIGSFKETDEKWNDGADWAIGQTKSFKLYGTLPDNYDEYDTYKYVFHDSLATQFDDPTNFVVVADGQTLTADTDYTVSTIETKDGKKEFSVSFSNLKSIKKTGTEDALINNKSVITVQYDTALNSTAIVGANGQQNEVYLEYSNNPNKSGEGDTDNTGKTPKDKVIVFTYALEFDKTFWEGSNELTDEEIIKGTYDDLTFTVDTDTKIEKYTGTDGKYDYIITNTPLDKDSEGNATLSALKLTLLKKDSTTGEWTPLTEDDKSTYFDMVDGKITGFKEGHTAEGENADVKLGIRIKGLDSKETSYKIVESGSTEYNNVTVENVFIESGVKYTQYWKGDVIEYTSAGEDTPESGIYQEIKNYFDKATTDTAAIVTKSGTVNGEIENKKGSQLPSTGGIGTTIFYLGGGAMVAVAGVFLITKKRMGKSEN